MTEPASMVELFSTIRALSERVGELEAAQNDLSEGLDGTDRAVVTINDRVSALEFGLEELKDQLALLLPDETKNTDGIPVPENFQFVLLPNRSSKVSWTDPVGKQAGDVIEVHEFEVDPANTLKSSLQLGVQARISSVLAGGRNYTYAVRTKRGSSYSPFTQRITLYVPATGESTTSTTPTVPVVPNPTGKNPADVLPELKTWTIMATTGSQGDPDNDYILGSVPNKYFVGSDGGVVFRADANGVHSPGSKYCRWEARQMKDANWTKAAWSSSGNHTLECVLAFDTSHLKFRRVNGMQIHDGSDDVCQIMRHESLGLGFMHNDGKTFVSIDPNYQDGTKVTVKIEAVSNVIRVYYNGVKKVEVAKTGTGWYWKAGCYNQTGGANTDRVEPAGNYGEVRIYRLATTGGAS